MRGWKLSSLLRLRRRRRTEWLRRQKHHQLWAESIRCSWNDLHDGIWSFYGKEFRAFCWGPSLGTGFVFFGVSRETGWGDHHASASEALPLCTLHHHLSHASFWDILFRIFGGLDTHGYYFFVFGRKAGEVTLADACSVVYLTIIGIKKTAKKRGAGGRNAHRHLDAPHFLHLLRCVSTTFYILCPVLRAWMIITLEWNSSPFFSVIESVTSIHPPPKYAISASLENMPPPTTLSSREHKPTSSHSNKLPSFKRSPPPSPKTPCTAIKEPRRSSSPLFATPTSYKALTA